MRNILTLITVIAIVFSGCKTVEDDGVTTIVTTTGIIKDCIENIVSEDIKVISLMGAGVDPHLYKASQGDISKLANADIIIYNGLHLEGKMAQMLDNYSKSKPAYAIGNFVSKNSLKKVDETSDLVDPHIWFNPAVWMEGLNGVAGELSKIEGLETTAANCRNYSEEVASISSGLTQLLDSTLDNENRVLITSHDAFEYFGDAYNFRVRGLQGISTAAEYGAKDVKDLIDFIIDNNIKSVFVETSVSDKNLRAVIEGAQARDYELKIGGTLYSDALGAEKTPAATYIGMLQANVHTIIEGLK
ncbi:MAG: zinc ABC transporter substrate-binding protein [Bacteroidia bacterium]|nr:zinc ABC transporter substrate-binding protein [Bacteroidia bacterium]NNJ54540.1 zinc ABC transporter solute-binding protein [Bacteroidia bacterium]